MHMKKLNLKVEQERARKEKLEMIEAKSDRFGENYADLEV